MEKFKIVERKPKQPEIDFAVEGMPEGYKLTYLGLIDSKTYFAIYYPKEVTGCDAKYKVAIGPKDSMEVCEVREVIGLLDGGTKIIYTERGRFYFPSPYNKDESPSFEGKPIQLIFPSKV